MISILRNRSSLPLFSSMLDEISRQRDIDETYQTNDSEAEDHLLSAMTAIKLSQKIVLYGHKKKSQEGLTDGPPLPNSFEEACNHPKWAAAINREYEVLLRRGTWELISRTPDMRPVLFKWAWRAKRLDETSSEFLYKARCVLPGDLQDPFMDFDPEKLYAPVGTHESLRMLLSFTAQNGLLFEGADESNAYLYGDIDKPIIMEQPINSTGKPEKPRFVCLLKKSLYGVKQAGHTWGSVLHKDLLSWSFKISSLDLRLYFLKKGNDFVILVVVVDDIAFASNPEEFLTYVKSQLRSTFDVKLYGPLRFFIRWTIRREPDGIEVDQKANAMKILSRFGLEKSNSTNTPPSTKPDLTPRTSEDKPLSAEKHNLYKSMIGTLSYLSLCTRPDLTFSVSCLSRFSHDPFQQHLDLAKRLFRYIPGTLDYGIHFRTFGNDETIRADCDSDWAGDIETRRSPT